MTETSKLADAFLHGANLSQQEYFEIGNERENIPVSGESYFTNQTEYILIQTCSFEICPALKPSNLH